jgi:hypothetical protein
MATHPTFNMIEWCTGMGLAATRSAKEWSCMTVFTSPIGGQVTN